MADDLGGAWTKQCLQAVPFSSLPVRYNSSLSRSMRHLMPIVTPRLILRPPTLGDLDSIQTAKEEADLRHQRSGKRGAPFLQHIEQLLFSDSISRLTRLRQAPSQTVSEVRIHFPPRRSLKCGETLDLWS
jgi:hypothetical protein